MDAVTVAAYKKLLGVVVLLTAFNLPFDCVETKLVPSNIHPLLGLTKLIPAYVVPTPAELFGMFVVVVPL